MATINRPRALYNSRGVRVPSVKTITNGLASGALMGWMRRNMNPEAKADAENKRVIGELAHEIIMSRYGADEPDCSPFTDEQRTTATDIADRFDAWVAYTFSDFVVLSTEVTLVSDELGYGGRFDMYASANGKRLLIELKTSPTMYDDHAWQLAGYWKLIQRECPELYPVDELHVICPNADTLGGAACVDFYINDQMRNAAMNVFDAAHEAYKARKVYTSVAG